MIINIISQYDWLGGKGGGGGRKQNKINKAMQNLDKYITTNNTL